MPVVTKDTLKTYFETGDYPTQQQFTNLIDSLRHVNDPIAFADLAEEVITAINNAADSTGNAPIVTEPGATTVTIPHGTLIDLVVVLNSVGVIFSAGWSDGGTDVIDNFQIPDNKSVISTIIYNRADEHGTLYLNGVTGGTVVKLYKR